MGTISHAEIVERSEKGPFSRGADYDLALVKKVPELVKRYKLKFDPEIPVPADDDLADRLYQAGMDLFVELGVYNQSSERRILFTRDEVETAVTASPSRLTLGTGRDAVVMRHRPVEGTVPCIIHSGPTGTPVSEEHHPLILLSCAQEPLVDGLGSGSESTYLGRQIIPGTPLEIQACRRDAVQSREVLRQAGRPGLHINDVAVPLTCAGKMAAFDPVHGLRPSDGLLVSQMVELKTDYDQLSRVAFMESVGINIVNLMTPLIGGFGGGAEGTAIVTMASHLLGAVLYRSAYHDMGHMSLRWSHNTGRDGNWIYALGGQALSRNTPLLSMTAIYTRSGLGTEELLWEVAAVAVAGTVSGLHHLGVGVTGGAKENHTSGLEARFNAEVAHACLGMSRKEANRLVLESLKRYEHTFDDPRPGKRFEEVYDLKKLEPNGEWRGAYHRVREELKKMGLNLDRGWKEVRRGTVE